MDGEYGTGNGGCELKDALRAVPRFVEQQEDAIIRIKSVVPESADVTPRRNATLIPPLINDPRLEKHNDEIRADFKRDDNYQEMPTEVFNVNTILKERGSRYGSFVGHAHVTIRLKDIITDELQKRNKHLLPIHREAIDMICHKLGRIINGDENYDDSWQDIAGYSQLVVDYIHGKLT